MSPASSIFDGRSGEAASVEFQVKDAEIPIVNTENVESVKQAVARNSQKFCEALRHATSSSSYNTNSGPNSYYSHGTMSICGTTVYIRGGESTRQLISQPVLILSTSGGTYGGYPEFYFNSYQGPSRKQASLLNQASLTAQ